MLPDAQPLPPLADTRLHLVPSPSAHSAYDAVLSAEEHFLEQGDEDAVMRTRVFGYFMLAFADFRHVLGDGPLSLLATEAHSPHRDANDAIAERGTYYLETLLLKQEIGFLPRQSEPPSRPSLTTLDDMVNEFIDASGTDCMATKKRALARDGFCCMVTGHIDYHSARANRRVQWPPGYEDKAFVLTECCYILPESTTQHADAAHPDHAPKRPGVASVLDVLQAFGLQDLATKLSDVNGIHHPSNVLTMHHYLHSMFRELLFWLEPTDIPNQYKVCFAPETRAANAPARVPAVVTFRAHPAARAHSLPLPDARLLALHAACARVANGSGAADCIARWEEDDAATPHLAEDGSGAPLLVERMRRVAIGSG